MTHSERPEGAILTPRSARVAKIAALSGRSVRQREGRFRVEGPQAVRALLEREVRAHSEHSSGILEELYLTDKARAAHPELAHLAERVSVHPRRATPEVIEAMVREQGHQSVAHPQGVIAVARSLERDWRDLLDDLGEGSCTIVVCERLQDPGNAGLVLRTSDASGAHAVFFSEGSADPLAPKVVRASAGSLFQVPFARKVPMEEFLGELRARGIATAATSPRGSENLFEWVPPTRLAWLMGNEAHGLDAATLEAADARVAIPIFGSAESLNLATAATLCLFESARTRAGAR